MAPPPTRPGSSPATRCGRSAPRPVNPSPPPTRIPTAFRPSPMVRFRTSRRTSSPPPSCRQSSIFRRGTRRRRCTLRSTSLPPSCIPARGLRHRWPAPSSCPSRMEPSAATTMALAPFGPTTTTSRLTSSTVFPRMFKRFTASPPARPCSSAFAATPSTPVRTRLPSTTCTSSRVKSIPLSSVSSDSWTRTSSRSRSRPLRSSPDSRLSSCHLPAILPAL